MAVSMPPEGRHLIERSSAELPSSEHHFRIAEGLSRDDEDEDGVTTPLSPLAIVLLALLMWLLFAAVAGLTIALIMWAQS
jgi:hypothetical protein